MAFNRPSVEVNKYRKASCLEAKILANEPLVDGDDEFADVRHITFDAPDYPYLEGQSVGVLAPGQTEAGKDHAVRLYSISSLGNDIKHNELLSVTVKRVVYADENEEKVYGVCSNYLASLKPGDSVRLTGPAGRKFLLPVSEELDRPYIFIATGTGIAPFRGMLKRLFSAPSKTAYPVHLFFGVKTSRELLYEKELSELAESNENFFMHTAISREQKNDGGGRMYVHHLLEKKQSDADRILNNEKGLIYLCGLRGMEEGVYGVIAKMMNLPSDSIKDHFGERIQTEVY
jgi:ferredoxin--NADP+ reductase